MTKVVQAIYLESSGPVNGPATGGGLCGFCMEGSRQWMGIAELTQLGAGPNFPLPARTGLDGLFLGACLCTRTMPRHVL